MLGTIYKAHWGSEGEREPASIKRFVTLLGKPGILSPKVKDFRVYAHLFDEILDAYVITLAAEKMLAVSEQDFHERLCETDLPRLINAIVDDIYPLEYHGIARVHQMRHGADGAGVAMEERDIIFENSLLLCQQGLVYRDFSSAVSAGDPGRLKHILSVWTTQLHGTSNINYPREMLHLMACLTKIWTPEMQNIWMQNCLVNPSGERGKWMADDLFGEYVVREIKAKINPSTNVLSDRHLCETIASQVMSLYACKKTMARECCSRNYGIRSTELSTSFDVAHLTRTLLEETIARFTPNRVRNEQGTDYWSAPDLLSVGAAKLASGIPLKKYRERARYFWISGGYMDSESYDMEDEDSGLLDDEDLNMDDLL